MRSISSLAPEWRPSQGTKCRSIQYLYYFLCYRYEKRLIDLKSEILIFDIGCEFFSQNDYALLVAVTFSTLAFTS